MTSRPVTLTVTAVVLGVVAVLSVLTGVAGTMVSSCCGSPDPADPTPAVVGVLLGAVLGAAAASAWTGRGGRRAVLGLTGGVLVVLVVLSGTSSDLAGLLVLLVPTWALLAVALSRPRVAAWPAAAGQRQE